MNRDPLDAAALAFLVLLAIAAGLLIGWCAS